MRAACMHAHPHSAAHRGSGTARTPRRQPPASRASQSHGQARGQQTRARRATAPPCCRGMSGEGGCRAVPREDRGSLGSKAPPARVQELHADGRSPRCWLHLSCRGRQSSAFPSPPPAHRMYLSTGPHGSRTMCAPPCAPPRAASSSSSAPYEASTPGSRIRRVSRSTRCTAGWRDSALASSTTYLTWGWARLGVWLDACLACDLGS